MPLPDSPRFSRRDLLGLIGAGAGFGVVTRLAARVGLAQAPGWQTARGTVTFPSGAVIRTVLKDVPPDVLRSGATMMHEHLAGVGSYSSPPPPSGCPMPCAPAVAGLVIQGADLLVEELKATLADGVTCIVNSTTALPTDQQIQSLRDLSTRSGMHIVAGGGAFRAAYPKNLAELSEDAFARTLAQAALTQRWGAFGEIGTSMQMEADERKFLIALSLAHQQTNLPIFTHIPHQSCPKCALEQLDILTSRGVNPRSLCIGHMSTIKLEDDPPGETLKAVAKAGAFIGFDTVGHQMSQSHIPERQKVARVLQVLEAGYEDHLLLSADFAQTHNLKANWGNGFSSVVLQFVPKLRYAGVKDDTLHKILVDNPRRFLAFVPKSA
jgi:predicted metal-dependent phosphotriesterase family hydrolase